MIQYISREIYKDFIRAVRSQSVLGREMADKTVPIVYTPLNGTGLRPVMEVLEESGFTNITVVEEQREPNGQFPTCPKPNPELKEVFRLGIKCAEKHQAALVVATDPDCDRVGIAVRDQAGHYVCLTGNETGVLLLDYLCEQEDCRRHYAEAACHGEDHCNYRDGGEDRRTIQGGDDQCSDRI